MLIEYISLIIMTRDPSLRGTFDTFLLKPY